MRPIEANWIRERILALGVERASPIANIGSSTLRFRTVNKPHIEELLFEPLRDAGFEIIHVDIKDAPGVDMVGDVTNAEFLSELKAKGCQSVICSNLLEHLTDRRKFVSALSDLINDDGVLVLTVPYSYPYHPDPIDTLYRPSPDELHRSLPGLHMIESAILADGSLVREIAAKGVGRAAIYLPVALLRIARVWRPKVALAQLHRLTWIVRPFKVSCAVLSKSH